VAASVKVKATGISEIVLTWKAPATKKVATDLNVIRYDIYDAKGTLIGSVDAGDVGAGGVFAFTVNNSVAGVNLQPKTSYSFRVVTVCQLKAGGPEIVSSKAVTKKVKTKAFVAPKAAKTITGDVGLTSITFRWQPHNNANGGYEIKWYIKNMLVDSETVAAGTTSFKIPDLRPGVKYTITVQALNTTVPGVPSATLKKSVVTLKFPATKTPTLMKSQLTSSSAALTWKATSLPKGVVGAVKYELYYTETKGLKPGIAGWTAIPLNEGEGVVATFTAATTATLTGLASGQTYYVYVRTIWGEDDTVFSNSGVLTFKTL